ncbi:hypothetical protein [Curvibacter gracilis]|uniref:hypothetical protein n=1 Tax=Curvibacter gracilis TaxID=230310 RepID=UPI0012FB7093|nr:hypothetical protein [Curvibacter gracilis]
MVFYSLLYVANFKDSVNLKVLQASAKHLVYLRNAVLLAKSIARFGDELTVLTNDRSYLLGLVNDNDVVLNFDVVEIEFDFQVSANVAFHSAHYKIDVFRYFAGLKALRCTLIDLDVVCLRRLPDFFYHSDDALVYNISQQVFEEYGSERVSGDLVRLGNPPNIFNWFGGELISGSPQFFEALYRNAVIVNKRYLACHKELHHEGDEMLVSVSLNSMIASGYVCRDISDEYFIYRHWSGVPGFRQRYLIALYARIFFLHLPQDKLFLSWFSKFNDDKFSEVLFSFFFFNYLAYRSFRNIFVKIYRLVKR